MSELIDRQQAIDALVAETIYTKEELREYHEANSHRNEWANGIYEAVEVIEQLPSAQPEREVYSNMSNKEFEKWLYEHGICHPDINEPIPCTVVPLLIDDAINELPSAEPLTDVEKRAERRE